MVTKVNTLLPHPSDCTCERCTEKLALIIWTNRLFRSLTVQAVRARVALLEQLPIHPEEMAIPRRQTLLLLEELEGLPGQSQKSPQAAGFSPPQGPDLLAHGEWTIP
jgi:hypothetical protein